MEFQFHAMCVRGEAVFRDFTKIAAIQADSVRVGVSINVLIGKVESGQGNIESDISHGDCDVMLFVAGVRGITGPG